ncbi:MAG: hypothetical protein J6W76_04490 [Spirochaetales bacterium]|nr:hypothetical protein [Spirochaetales bacterium]
MTISEAAAAITSLLNAPFIETPDTEARIILCHILQWDNRSYILNKNSTIVPLSEWTIPTDWASADLFILEMIRLIAANRMNEMPIETIGAAIDQLSQLCQDQNNQHHSAVLLMLTGISEMAQLCQKNSNEYDIHYTAVMKQITDYARSICEAANYLDKLSAVNAPKSNLIRDILRSIKLCSSENLKELLNAILIFVVSLEI